GGCGGGWGGGGGAAGAVRGRKGGETRTPPGPPPARRRGPTRGEIASPRRWRDMPKVVFSSTTSTVDWNTRLVTGDAVTEITRLKAGDGGPMDIGGATLAAAAMRAGLIDEYALATAPVLVGSGTPFFTALDNWVNLTLVENPDVSRWRGPHQVRDQALSARRRIGAAVSRGTVPQSGPEYRTSGFAGRPPLRRSRREKLVGGCTEISTSRSYPRLARV